MATKFKFDTPEETKKHLTQVALRFLGYRDRFTQEIDRRLRLEIKKRSLPEDSLDLIPSVISRLKKMGLIDDQQLAKDFINGQINQLKGPYLIRQKLFKFGLSQSFVDSQISAIFTPQKQNQAIAKIISKRLIDHTPESLYRLQNLLLRRGFSGQLVRKKIDSLAKKE